MEKSGRKKEILSWIRQTVIVLLVVLFARSFLFNITAVQGESMQQTLYTGDRMLVTIADAKLYGYDRFDIAVCLYPGAEDKQYVKRVIGLPGETIELREGVTRIDGQPIDESFLSERCVRRYGGQSWGPYTIPEGHYFVMGDNRDDSKDSRQVGFIEQDRMLGKSRFLLWPPSRIGGVR